MDDLKRQDDVILKKDDGDAFSPTLPSAATEQKKPDGNKGLFYWYFMVLKRYAVFSGRAGRREYWYFVLGNSILSFLLGIFYDLAVVLPLFGVTSRRLHDTGHSGVWGFVLILSCASVAVFSGIICDVFAIISVLLGAYVFWLTCKKGDASPNKYGDVPSV